MRVGVPQSKWAPEPVPIIDLVLSRDYIEFLLLQYTKVHQNADK